MAKLTFSTDDAVQALKNLESQGKLAKMTMKELSAEIMKVAQSTSTGTGKVGDYADALEKRGIKTLKEFRREQRDQNYITRQGTQALTNMVFALGFLTQGQSGASVAAKRLTEGLLAGVGAMNAADFSLFALGRTGKKVGGTMGSMMTKISSLAGPIALVIGLSAAFIAFFTKSGEAAEEAAEKGIARFKEEISGLPGPKLKATIEDIKAALDVIGTEEQELRVKNLFAGTSGLLASGKKMSEQDKERLKSLRETREHLNEMLKNAETQEKVAEALAKGEALQTQLLGRRRGELAGINIELTKQNEKLKDTTLTNEEIRMITDKILQLETRKKEILKSTLDIEKERAELQKKIDEEASARLVARLEGERELAELLKEVLQEGEIPLPDVPVDEIARKRAELIDDETARIREKYRVEKEIIEREINEAKSKGEDIQLKELQLVKLRKDAEKEIADIQQRQFDIMASRWEALLNILAQSLSGTSDSFARRMIAALQIAVQIAKTIQAIDAKKEGAGGLDILTLLAQAGGLFGKLFGYGGGGYTGDGSDDDIAGTVHRKEIVFERTIVERNRDDLLMLRRALQAGATVRSAVPSVSGGGPSEMGILIRELQALRRDVRTLEIQQPIMLKANLDSIKFLRENMPGYEQFAAKKDPG